MKRKIRTLNLSGPLGKALLISALLSLPAQLLHAQEIQIRVLNGRNGKPIAKECINVSLGSWHGADLLVPTNKDGIAVLHLRGNDVTADAACQGWSKQAHRSEGVDTISVMGDYYVACQEYGKLAPSERPTPETSSTVIKELVPTYSIKEILQSGIASANTCGKVRGTAKLGELIFFVRPRGFLERLKQ
jgi:hypothetical protein